MANDSELSLDEVLEQLAARGKPLTKTQLAYARRSKLIPVPRRRSLGRGRGTVSLYPAELVDHLDALVDARRKHRTNDHVAWTLWWQDYEIPTDVIRAMLSRQGGALDEEIAKLRLLLDGQADAGLTAEWERWIYEESLLPIADRPLRQMRKRVGSSQFSTLILLIAEVVTGRFSGFQRDPVFSYAHDSVVPQQGIVLEKALGLDRARTDRLLGLPPWLAGNIEEDLREVSELFRSQSFQEHVDGLTFDQLSSARREFRRFAGIITRVAALVEWVWGPHRFGFTVTAKYLRSDDPVQQQVMFLSWLNVMRIKKIREGARAFVGLEATIEQAEDSVGQLSILATEVVALRSLLDPKRIRQALRNPTSLGRFSQQLDRVQRLHRAAIEAALRRSS